MSILPLCLPLCLSSRPPTSSPSTLQRWVDAEGWRFELRALQPQDAPFLGELRELGLTQADRYNLCHVSLGRFSVARGLGVQELEVDMLPANTPMRQWAAVRGIGPGPHTADTFGVNLMCRVPA